MLTQNFLPAREQEILILRGLPGCGKSTLAQEITETYPLYEAISKDTLRELHPGESEKQIHARQMNWIEVRLALGRYVIIDNTNLNPKTVENYKTFAAEKGVGCRVYDMTDVPWWTCVARDRRRKVEGKRYTGRSVIIEMALRWGLYKPFPSGFAGDNDGNRERVAIVDIDGTAALIDHRRHFVQTSKGNPKDWKSFFGAMEKDKPNEAVRTTVWALHESGFKIIFCSGRPADYRRITEDWLTENNFPHYAVLMRRFGDKRPDNIIKQEIYEQLIKPYFQVELVLDDRDSVVKMWREQGLTCMQVAEGDF
jgi:predicted kinase